MLSILPAAARQAVTRAIEAEQFASAISWTISRSLSDLIAERIQANLVVVDQLRQTMKADRARFASALDEVATAVAELERISRAAA